MTDDRPHVLYVEDDPDLARSFARIAHSHGYTVTVESTYADADLLDPAQFDTIVADYDLGDPHGRTGLDLLFDVGVSHPDVRRVLVSGLERRTVAGVEFYSKAHVRMMLDAVIPDRKVGS